MEKERINYGETFCDAIDIIVSEKLKKLEYDVTKMCTIVDNVYKSLGRYTVQEETVKYEAYSTNTNFAIGDSVLVVIPNGDYNMQKMILSKVAEDSNLQTSVAYVSPLEKMLDFTGNIIPEAQEFSLLANDPDVTEQLIYSISWNGGVYDGYSDYTRMGVSVDFQTWLSELNVVSGSYGLMFYFYDNTATVTDREKRNSAYSLILNTSDILGNPYDFESYSNQQKLFDISYLKNITQLDIYFYQNKDFKNAEGKLVDYRIEDKILNEEFFINGIIEPENQKLNHNLFVKNLKIYLGYDINAFSDDELRISTNDANTYSATNKNNDKNLILKWIHKVDDNKYVLMDNESDDIELYWVRYGTTSQAIENIVGKGWTQEKMNVNHLNPFSCTLNIDVDLNKAVSLDVKVVGRVRQKDGNWSQYSSNILTFYSTDPRVDETTYNATTSLSLYCDDGTEGNYFLYNQNSELINEGQGQGYVRLLKLYYKGQPIIDSAEMKDNIDEVQWTIPINSDSNPAFTMLHWEDIVIPEDDEESSITLSEDKKYKIITFKGKDVTFDYSLRYSISNTWYAMNSCNIIQCKVLSKTGILYTAQKELTFGKANSQGSNISLILQYVNNQNAYEVKTDNDNKVIGHTPAEIQALMYDLSGKLISPNGQLNWTVEGKDFTINKNAENSSKATLTLNSGVKTLSFDNYNILKVEYVPSSGNSIVAYLPISIQTNNGTNLRCTSMEGARTVIYNAAGVPSYYTGAYVLRDGQEPIGVKWSINLDKLYTEKEKINNYPTLSTTNGQSALLANPIYIKDYEYEVVVIAKSGNTIYWVQPILIMQSAYDFATINNWNGTSVLSGDNSVIAGVIAAGKKSASNKFSGILLGDISEDLNNELVNTGLYGILDGVITFALTDSGNATFEYTKNNSNSILTNSSIHFGDDNYLISNTDSDKYFTLDIDDQFLELRNSTTDEEGSVLTLSAGAPYLKLENKYGTILSFNKTSNYLQTAGFNSTKGIKIDLGAKSITGRADSKLTWNGTATIGKLSVDENGEIFYNGKTLAEYIKEITK